MSVPLALSLSRLDNVCTTMYRETHQRGDAAYALEQAERTLYKIVEIIRFLQAGNREYDQKLDTAGVAIHAIRCSKVQLSKVRLGIDRIGFSPMGPINAFMAGMAFITVLAKREREASMKTDEEAPKEMFNLACLGRVEALENHLVRFPIPISFLHRMCLHCLLKDSISDDDFEVLRVIIRYIEVDDEFLARLANEVGSISVIPEGNIHRMFNFLIGQGALANFGVEAVVHPEVVEAFNDAFPPAEGYVPIDVKAVFTVRPDSALKNGAQNAADLVAEFLKPVPV